MYLDPGSLKLFKLIFTTPYSTLKQGSGEGGPDSNSNSGPPLLQYAFGLNETYWTPAIDLRDSMDYLNPLDHLDLLDFLVGPFGPFVDLLAFVALRTFLANFSTQMKIAHRPLELV